MTAKMVTIAKYTFMAVTTLALAATLTLMAAGFIFEGVMWDPIDKPWPFGVMALFCVALLMVSTPQDEQSAQPFTSGRTMATQTIRQRVITIPDCVEEIRMVMSGGQNVRLVMA